MTLIRLFTALIVCASLAAAPKVVITSPDHGEIDVSPDVKEIRIEFDQPMNPRGRSVIGGGPSFPKIAGDLKWADNKTFIIPVALEADHQYQLSVNSDTFKGFTSRAGEPAEWYPITFKTRAAGAAPAKSDVTPEQNKAAFAALQEAINKDYSYRDRKKINWEKEFAARKDKFEKAKTANEFARLTAHLLRLAEDAHVSVQAGDVRIGTRANSTSANFNYDLLQQKVPKWKEGAGGIITGRFDDGIGYILFADCSKEQADGFDQALNELKDTKALILDARLNGGGDEEAAQRVAGRFIDKPAVYSKNRLRENGSWNGPFDRTVTPRADAERYTKPVAVLIGPKVGSSAESFVAMMKFAAKAKLIGEPTKGSSGRPMPHELGNGVTVYLSSWEDDLPDGTAIEGKGIRPDIVIKTNPADLQKRDAVLDTALMLHRSAQPKPSKAAQ
jgi:hypothetical protein